MHNITRVVSVEVIVTLLRVTVSVVCYAFNEVTIVKWAPLEVGDLATYLGFGAAAVAALFAGLAFRKQSISTSIQLGHLRTEEQRARHLDAIGHASRISAWHSASSITLLNRSDEPVYEVVLTEVFIQGAGPRTGEDVCKLEGVDGLQMRHTFSVLPPGEWDVEMTDDSPIGAGMSSMAGTEIGFTDRNGSHWIRRSNGSLDKIQLNAIDHYGLIRPLGLFPPMRRAGNRDGNDQV